MAVTRIGQSTIKQGLKKNETFTAGIPPILGKFYHMGTVEVGAGGASSIEFTGIPAIYKHLQIRLLGKAAGGTTWYNCDIRFNSDAGSNYSYHALQGDGASPSTQGYTNTPSIYTPMVAAGNKVYPGAGIIDILEYSNTSKYKTIKSLTGTEQNGSGRIILASGSWRSLSAISSISILQNNIFTEYSVASLYGVK